MLVKFMNPASTKLLLQTKSLLTAGLWNKDFPPFTIVRVLYFPNASNVYSTSESIEYNSLILEKRLEERS